MYFLLQSCKPSEDGPTSHGNEARGTTPSLQYAEGQSCEEGFISHQIGQLGSDNQQAYLTLNDQF